MTWMQRLKRVFNIGIEVCEKCQGLVKNIACVENPAAIEKILKHLKAQAISNTRSKVIFYLKKGVIMTYWGLLMLALCVSIFSSARHRDS